jgi:hypothetical protein
LKRLTQRGYENETLFTSRFKGCQLNENINGVDIIREGNKICYTKRPKIIERSQVSL